MKNFKWVEDAKNHQWIFFISNVSPDDMDVMSIVEKDEEFYLNSYMMRVDNELLGASSIEEAKELAFELFYDFVDQEVEFYTEILTMLKSQNS